MSSLMNEDDNTINNIVQPDISIICDDIKLGDLTIDVNNIFGNKVIPS